MCLTGICNCCATMIHFSCVQEIYNEINYDDGVLIGKVIERFDKKNNIIWMIIIIMIIIIMNAIQIH